MAKEQTTDGEKRYTWVWRKIDEGVNWVTYRLEPIVITYIRSE